MFGLEMDIRALLVATLLGLGLILANYFLRRFERPFLYYSQLHLFSVKKSTWREKLVKLPRYLLVLAWIFLALAYSDPHRFVPKTPSDEGNMEEQQIPTEGIAIYLVLDNSRSMGEEIEISTPSGRRKILPKMEILKEVTQEFVQGDQKKGLKGRSSDLIGLVTFARSAKILSPLTLDHETILQELQTLNTVKEEKELGTAIGYSIFKTANLIEATKHFGQDLVKNGTPAYEIKNSIIVLVTDGLQETHPEDYDNPLRSIDLIDAGAAAKEMGITLYIINIDPKINSAKFSDYRKLYKLLTEMTGGKFYYVDSTRDLEEIYTEIDQIEKSLLPSHTKQDKEKLPNLYKRVDYYKLFISLGLGTLFFALFLMTTILRRVP